MNGRTKPPPRGQDAKQPGRGGRFPFAGLLLFAGVLAFAWFSQSQRSAGETPSIDYSEFYTLVEDGAVKSVILEGQQVEGQLVDKRELDGTESESFTTVRPEQDEALIATLREHDVSVRVEPRDGGVWTQLLVGLLPWIILGGVWFWLMRRARRMMGGGGAPFLGGAQKSNRKISSEMDVQVSFSDVAGLENAKRDSFEIIEYLKEPLRFRKLGGKVPRGVLMVGPPGTGKTLLARAMAGEAGVPFFSISAAEFIEMFVGVGAGRVRSLFEDAKKHAPSIVFIDELDAIGRARGAGLGGGHDEREQTLNQLLSEMDGFTRRDLTIVLAATNRPDVLDPALLRPGRFDRQIMVDRPAAAARREILKTHTRDKPLADDVDLEQIARMTAGFSGADLENLANEAALNAVRRDAEQVESSDFTAAFDKVVLGNPREGKLDEKERERVAVHETGHAVVAHFAAHAEPLHRVSIIPRGMALGATHQSPTEDRNLMTQPELESRLRVLMGGYASERLVLGTTSTGAESDLKKATDIATRMVAHYGMSDKLGVAYYEYRKEHPFLGRHVATDTGTSDATVNAIEREAGALLTAALEGAEAILQRHRDKVDQLIDEVLKAETVEKDKLYSILGEGHTADAAVTTEPAHS